MSKWKNSKLDDVTVLIKDGTHGSHKDFPNGIPLLSAKDIENGKILIPDDCRTISENEYNLIHTNYKIENDDLLLTIVGTIGRVAIAKELKKKITFQRSVGIIRFDKNIIFPYYSFYFFQSDNFQQTLERSKNASAQGGVYLGELAKATIAHPISLPEQRKIAQILSTTDSVIEKTQAAIAKYKAIKQGMLHDLFTRGIDVTTGKLRPKQQDAPKLYKESKLGWIPKEWDEGKFIDFADENIHHSFTGGPFGSDLQTKHYTNTGVRIIQLQNIGDGVFNDEYKIYTSEERANYLINCNIYHGEIIISKMADPIARACIIPKTEKRYLMASDGIRLSIDKKKFNSRFVMETINHNRFRKIAELKATGSTRARIGLTELREISVIYPNKIEQDAIGFRIDTIEANLNTEHTYLQKLQMLKSGLMNDLLSGKKEVKLTDHN